MTRFEARGMRKVNVDIISSCSTIRVLCHQPTVPLRDRVKTPKTSCRRTRVEPTQRVSVQHAHKIYFIMNNDDAKHTCIHMYYNNMLVQI